MRQHNSLKSDSQHIVNNSKILIDNYFMYLNSCIDLGIGLELPEDTAVRSIQFVSTLSLYKHHHRRDNTSELYKHIISLCDIMISINTLIKTLLEDYKHNGMSIARYAKAISLVHSTSTTITVLEKMYLDG